MKSKIYIHRNKTFNNNNNKKNHISDNRNYFYIKF